MGVPAPRRIDVTGWLALAWAVAFGLVYAGMVLRERAPGLVASLRKSASG